MKEAGWVSGDSSQDRRLPDKQSTDGGMGNGRDEDGGLLVLVDPCRGPEFLLTAIDPVLHLTRAT